MTLITTLIALTVTLHMQIKTPLSDQPHMAVCTGVWISPTEVLTAAHCTEGTRKIWIKDSDNHSFSAEVERYSHKLDLSVIKIKDAPKHQFVRLGPVVGRGDRVYTVNSGEDFINTYNEGIVQNIIKDPDNDTVTLLHSAFILAGASGSGLFNAKGELVAINTAVYKSMSSAVDVTEIYYFLSGQLR